MWGRLGNIGSDAGVDSVAVGRAIRRSIQTLHNSDSGSIGVYSEAVENVIRV